MTTDDMPVIYEDICRHCGVVIMQNAGGTWVDATDGDACDVAEVHEVDDWLDD